MRIEKKIMLFYWKICHFEQKEPEDPGPTHLRRLDLLTFPTLSSLISVQHILILFENFIPPTCFFTRTNEKKESNSTFFHILTWMKNLPRLFAPPRSLSTSRIWKPKVQLDNDGTRPGFYKIFSLVFTEFFMNVM